MKKWEIQDSNLFVYNPQKRVDGIFVFHSLTKHYMRSRLLKIKIYSPHDSKGCEIQNQRAVRGKIPSAGGDFLKPLEVARNLL